jgi:hypothetical protein
MTTGLLIAVYILVMGRLNVDRSVEDPVKVEAIKIANQIVSITEPHSGFGQISLCKSAADDRYGFGGQTHRTTSLNEAKSVLHSAAVVAKGLNSTLQEEHIIEDLNDLEVSQQRLIAKIFDLVATPEGNAKSADANSPTASLHARVLKTLQDKDPTDLKTVALSLRLGRYSHDTLLKTSVIPPSEGARPYADAGYYRADFPVPIARDRVVRFYAFAEQVTLVDPVNFIESAPGALPNAVLMEVKYEPKGKSKTSVYKVRRLCALLGGAASPAMPSSLLFRFPQGLPDTFNKPAAFLNKQVWTNAGTWQQASGGTVPGNGKLKLTIDPVLPRMQPGDALAIGIYHWIRHLRPAPDPQAVLNALNQPIPLSEPKLIENKENATAPVNSCLVADTGAREHSFAKNTEADSESQRAIEQVFEYPGRLEEYPQSSMPLYVDRTGNVNLAGRTGFDSELVGRYLTAVYSTNLAALESIATTKLVRRQCAIESRELELKLSIKRQELASLSKALSAVKVQQRATRDQTGEENLSRQIRKMERTIEELKTSVLAIENRKAQLHTVTELARTVMLNADRCTARTYELCSTTFTMLRNGLHVFDAPAKGFLIGRKTVFLPIEDPVKESHFFEAAAWANSDPYFRQEKISAWFQKQLPVLVPAKELLASTRATIDQKTLTEIVSEVEVVDNMPPLTVLLDSRDLYSVARAQLHTSSEYPFGGTPISEDQAFFYAKSATTTGASQDVVWSVVMRDLVFHEIGKGKVIAGPTNTSWEKRFKPPIEGPSGLAVEFQLRRPLPRIEGMPAGAYITDPNKRLMTPQIPPVPVELM